MIADPVVPRGQLLSGRDDAVVALAGEQHLPVVPLTALLDAGVAGPGGDIRPVATTPILTSSPGATGFECRRAPGTAGQNLQCARRRRSGRRPGAAVEVLLLPA